MLADLIKQKEYLERQIIRAAVAFAESTNTAKVTLGDRYDGTHEWKPEIWEAITQVEPKEQKLLRAANDLIQFLTNNENRHYRLFEYDRKDLGIVENPVETDLETP